jgi:CheY-like chemotaxis protein
VIQNILINADQAMPEGGSIEITAQNVTAPDNNHPQLPKGNYIEIAIKDSGIGIPEKYREKIFDPYFTTKEKGSGLGLATSYSIIRNHGGLINVVSEPGKGTTFFIYLPAVEAEKEIKEIPAASSATRKGKILVMDDEDMILSIAGKMIKALGHDVDFAKHGEAAVEKYRSAREAGTPFDIVILDLTIRGGMGGAETIEQLRALDPRVKAIVSSGYSEDDIVADYEKYGFKARLTKPYRLNGLKDTLNALLSA